MKPLGLYIHIPFCPYRCHYCDFVITVGREQKIPDYVKAICLDLKQYAETMPGYEIASIYIGGGTPSLLPPSYIEEILICARESFRAHSDLEISLESNPETLTIGSLVGYRKAGTNRLSLGVQSTHPKHLKRMGRGHTTEEAHRVFLLAREAGFENLNVDLMFGLPDQTVEEWDDTLAEVLSWKPDHLSAYGLQVEEKTAFWKENRKGLLLIPEQESQAQMYEALIETCAKHGLEQYEISNFAKTGRACRHNLIYWHNEEYLGIGLGAVSYIEGTRFWMTRNFKTFLSGEERIVGNETLDNRRQLGESLMLALRLKEGISLNQFRAHFSTDLKAIYPTELDRYTQLGLLNLQGDRLALSPKGMLLSNEVLQAFI